MSSDIYTRMQSTASRLLKQYGQGEVLLERRLPGTPDTDRPWLPGLPETMTYRLDAVIRSVDRRFVDGTLVVGTERQATFSVYATHIETNGSPVSPVVVAVVPTMADTLIVDGNPTKIKKIAGTPDAGVPVVYVVVMES